MSDGSVGDLLQQLAAAPDADIGDAEFTDDGGIRVPIAPLRDEPLVVKVAAGERIELGRFVLLRAIGAGGMGVVFEAMDPMLARKVAIKVLRAHVGEATAARLVREAQALARLSHPNVVTVYEAGIDGDRVFLAMELVTGMTVRAWSKARVRTAAEVLALYRQAAAGLGAAHATGLVHRDIKPENILVGDDGRVRVTDFGLVTSDGTVEPAHPIDPATVDSMSATLTRTGAVLGTPPYVPPEAHRGQQVDARGDQWSLAVSLWEALAGRRPHAGATYHEVIANVCAGVIEGSSLIAPSLREVLERALSVDPAQRWPSVEAMFEALDRPRRSRWRRRVVPILIGAAAVGAAGLGVVAVARGRAAVVSPAGERAIERLTAPGACPYMPAFADDETIAFDDGNGDLGVIRPGQPALPVLVRPLSDWRVSRGRRAGEVLFLSEHDVGYLDLATAAIEHVTLATSTAALAGDALYYGRPDLPEIRRVRGGEDTRLLAMPGGLWPYTIAGSADGARLVVTTASDRSPVRICEVAIASAAVTCLPRQDIELGRAAFGPDGALYYQTHTGIRRQLGAVDEMLVPGAIAHGGIDVAPDGHALVYSDARPTGVEVTFEAEPPIALGDTSTPLAAGESWVYARTVDSGQQLVLRAPDGTIRVLAEGFGTVSSLGVDPTGQRIAFDVDGPAPGIHVVDRRGYPPQRITTTASDSNPVWTADGRIAFTRWTAEMQPSIYLADADAGDRGDLDRRAALAVPRTTADRVPTTGELVLVGLDGLSVWLWNPVTGAERKVPTAPLAAMILQVTAAPDGQSLVLLTGDGMWRVGLGDGGTPEHLRAVPRCGTYDRAVFDTRGRLGLVMRPWRGDIYRVALP